MSDWPPDPQPVRALAANPEQTVTQWWAGEYGELGRLVHALLAPVEAGYRAVVWARNLAYDRGVLPVRRLEIPVVSVGNLAIGGAGKTPVAAWLVEQLIGRGHQPAVLHGGYAQDEPELHRRWHPDVAVYAQRNRVAAGRLAARNGATVLVMDDGFQHRRLWRTLDVVLIAAESFTARPSMLPRGPWREGYDSLARADLIAVTRKTLPAEQAADVARAVSRHASGRPILRLAIRPNGWVRASRAADPPPGRALAVAGVAQPALFAGSARGAGAEVERIIAYPDHHVYTEADAAQICALAAGMPIVTTEKDWVKLAGFIDDTLVWVLLQRIEVEEGAALLDTALDAVK